VILGEARAAYAAGKLEALTHFGAQCVNDTLCPPAVGGASGEGSLRAQAFSWHRRVRYNTLLMILDG